MLFLGLDISTSVTGYTLIDKDGKVLKCSNIKLKDENSLFDKAEAIRSILKYEIFDRYSVNQVFIESSLLSFAGGKSSASVIATLTKFNGIVSYIIEKEFQIKPNFIMATSARKQIGIKIIKGIKAKIQVMDHVLQNELWYKPEFKKTGKIKDYCFDEIDSWVICKAGYLQALNNKIQA